MQYCTACRGYRRYHFGTNPPIKSIVAQIKSKLENLQPESLDEIETRMDALSEKIDASIANLNSSIETLPTNNDIQSLHDHIGCSSRHIIEHITPICTCGLATKEDVRQAVADINEHTNIVFGDLNQMIEHDDTQAN